MEFSVINLLVWVAFALLLTVTGGVLYLTAIEWRDRRQQERVKRKR